MGPRLYKLTRWSVVLHHEPSPRVGVSIHAEVCRAPLGDRDVVLNNPPALARLRWNTHQCDRVSMLCVGKRGCEFQKCCCCVPIRPHELRRPPPGPGAWRAPRLRETLLGFATRGEGVPCACAAAVFTGGARDKAGDGLDGNKMCVDVCTHAAQTKSVAPGCGLERRGVAPATFGSAPRAWPCRRVAENNHSTDVEWAKHRNRTRVINAPHTTVWSTPPRTEDTRR